MKESNVGKWYAKKDSLWANWPFVRKIIFENRQGTVVVYREYNNHEIDYFKNITIKSMKAWGKSISEEEAYKIIPDIKEQDQRIKQKTDEDVNLSKAVTMLWFLAGIPDDYLLAEVKNRFPEGSGND